MPKPLSLALLIAAGCCYWSAAAALGPRNSVQQQQIAVDAAVHRGDQQQLQRLLSEFPGGPEASLRHERSKRTLFLKKKILGAGLLGLGLGAIKGYKLGAKSAPEVHHIYLPPPPPRPVKYVEYVEKPVFIEKPVFKHHLHHDVHHLDLPGPPPPPPPPPATHLHHRFLQPPAAVVHPHHQIQHHRGHHPFALAPW